MTRKNNENRVVYAALIVVITVLSILVIVTGIVSRRNDSKKDGDTSDTAESTAADATKPVVTDKPTVTTPDTMNRVEEPKETEPPETEKDADATLDAEDVIATPTEPEFSSPISGAVSKEHSETVLVYSMTMNDYRIHNGIDIACETGAYVRAVADGVVKDVWEDPMWGYCISVAHEADFISYYKNLSRESMYAVGSGDEISRGDVIATVGESALLETADEPHLHFEMKLADGFVDPLEYFEVTGQDDIGAE